MSTLSKILYFLSLSITVYTQKVAFAGPITDDYIYAVYIDDLARLPDTAGFAYYYEMLGLLNNTDVKRYNMAVQVLSSREAKQLKQNAPIYVSTENGYENYLFVRCFVYPHLLNRKFDLAGLSYWTESINRGNSRLSVTASVQASQEYYQLNAYRAIDYNFYRKNKYYDPGTDCSYFYSVNPPSDWK